MGLRRLRLHGAPGAEAQINWQGFCQIAPHPKARRLAPRRRHVGRVARALNLPGISNTTGAPSFGYFAKGLP